MNLSDRAMLVKTFPLPAVYQMLPAMREEFNIIGSGLLLFSQAHNATAKNKKRFIGTRGPVLKLCTLFILIAYYALIWAKGPSNLLAFSLENSLVFKQTPNLSYHC